MWDLIVSVPDHCLSFYFTGKQGLPSVEVLHEFTMDRRHKLVVSTISYTGWYKTKKWNCYLFKGHTADA